MKRIISNKTLYLLLNFAKDFAEAKKILKTFFIEWSNHIFTAEGDELPIKEGYEQFRVMVNKKQKQIYILHDAIDPKEIKDWVESEELGIIDYKEDLVFRLARELFVAVEHYGCGDHFQDGLKQNMCQIYQKDEGDSFAGLYQGFDVRKHRHFDKS